MSRISGKSGSQYSLLSLMKDNQSSFMIYKMLWSPVKFKITPNFIS